MIGEDWAVEMTRVRIFEPFFTYLDLRRGTGLGLSMVYGIIKQRGGQILCHSEPGKGTTFKVYLPLLSSGDEMATLKTGAAAPEEPARGMETILVAEDDKVLRSLATTILQEAGYTVIEAADGEDAVRKFEQDKDKVKLVICDVIMPRKSGEEVPEEIMKISPAVKILFMSGYPADIIRQKSLLEEGAEIVMKPIPPMVLPRKVREVLDAR
jgi:CheY-like chemotaxis protein